MSSDSERSTARLRARRDLDRQHIRFLVESTLTFVLGALLWYAWHASLIADVSRAYYSTDAVLRIVWVPFFIYSGVGLTLFVMVYYGTSFQMTPFRIFLPFLRKNFFLKTLIPNSEVSVTRDDDTIAKLESEVVIESPSDSRISELHAAGIEGLEHPETVDLILREAAQSAQALADKMENRINLHLAFGVLTGGVGLAVWYMTFYHAAVARPTDLTISGRAFDALPRLTILFFIELLAGFFLRQYRIGVEDLKYFLELKRRADAKRIAYTIFERINNTEAKLDFAKQLLQEKSDTRLAKDEITTTLYALDKEKNEVLQAVEIMVEKLGAAAKELKKEKS